MKWIFIMLINKEGLTWVEWFSATMFNKSKFTSQQINKLKKAWKNGEDPTDYRAFGIEKVILYLDINA